MQHFESNIVDSMINNECNKKTGLGGQNKALKIQFTLVDSQVNSFKKCRFQLKKYLQVGDFKVLKDPRLKRLTCLSPLCGDLTGKQMKMFNRER